MSIPQHRFLIHIGKNIQTMTRIIRTLFCCLLLVIVVGLAACQPFADEPPAGDSPYALREPFLGIWQSLLPGIGSPRSEPLWLDGHLVQFFDYGFIQLNEHDPTNVIVQRQAVDWPTQLPADLLRLEVAPYRADLELALGAAAMVQPLQPLTVTLRIASYTGPAELRLYDGRLHPVTQQSVAVQAGNATLSVLPRGALGPQWALVLIDGRLAGARRVLFTLDASSSLATGRADLDALYPAVQRFMEQDVTAYELDGHPVRGYRSPDNPLLWLRDHVYQGRGFRYFERDVTSLLDAFRRAQRPDGSFPDVIDYPSLHVTAHRKEVESDLEFLFVQGVYEAWQITGDDAWLQSNLEAMRRGLRYITSDPLRWDAGYGLVRRPYTIDTWDFEYGPTTISPDGKPAPRHWIDDQTIWGIFHGDNTGLAYALELMARIEERVGDPAAAPRWRAQREAIVEQLNDLAWNGRFFTHFIHAEGPRRGQTPDVPGVDTAAQLSLSNAYALNRELLDFRQGRAIVESYYARRDFNRSFAEWYSIDPPFPSGSYGMGGRPGDDPGEYVNGGIMPLVGGELARGAFRYGAEAYGFDVLNRYAALLRLTGETYLWYYPDGRPGISGPHTLPTDGWGSSAMLGALMEGAAGIEDQGSRYSELRLSPRWSAQDDIMAARVVARYAASDGYVAYTWQRGERSLTLDLTGSWQRAQLRLLLPTDVPATVQVQLNGAPVPFEIEQVANSRYVSLAALGGNATLTVVW